MTETPRSGRAGRAAPALRRACRAALLVAFLLGIVGAAAAQQDSPLPPPDEIPASRLTVTPSDFARWVAGTPDQPEVAAVPEDRPPTLVAPPPPPPPLLTQPQPPAQLAPPPVLTPPAAPTLPPAGTDPTPGTTPPPAVATTPPAAPQLSPPDAPQVATLPPDSRDTTPVPAVPESQPRPEAIRILYAADATDLPQAAEDDLAALADWLQANPAVRVQIVGYASAATKSGSDARRRALFRTLAVRTYLIENGVLSTRMDVRALGDRTEEEPKDRVEVRVPPS